MIDALTKYVLLYHTTNIDTKNFIQAFNKSVSLFGAPSRVIVDQRRFANYVSQIILTFILLLMGRSNEL